MAPHFRDLNRRQRKAALKTINDHTIQNPRATELRSQYKDDMTEAAPHMSSHELTEALAEVVDIDTATPAEPPVVRVAIPKEIGPQTPAGDLRLALLTQFPIRGAGKIEGVPTDNF
jgi:hypothetical protein